MAEQAKVNENGSGGQEEAVIAFIDHHRQRYADRVTIPCDAEFLVGDYEDGGGVGDLGEFKIQLHYLGDRSRLLHPQLCIFEEGTNALAALLNLAGGDLDRILQPVADREEFAARLAAFGLRDASDEPPAEGR